MDQPMSKEDNAIKYYKQFLDLTKPLLDTHRLDNEDCWYGFHPEDHVMLLCWLRSENPNWWSGIFFTLQQVLHTTRNIFSQEPGNFQEELEDALEWWPSPSNE
jgi:hypothetical protein